MAETVNHVERLVITNDRIVLNGVELRKVRAVDIKNIGPTGSPMEVTLSLDVDEVDVEYSNFSFQE